MSHQHFNVHGKIDANVVSLGNDNEFTISQTPGTPDRPWTDPAPAVGIITALPEEFVAMRVLLDEAGEEHTMANDPSCYVGGFLPSQDHDRAHSVILTLLGDTGNTPAAECCTNLCRSFPSVNTLIMTGIACGVPALDSPARHVRLGDVVVSSWGVVDYDHVVEAGEGRRSRQPFPLPSASLVRAAKHLTAGEQTGQRPWEEWIAKALLTLPQYRRPHQETDLLYDAESVDRVVPHPPAARTGHRPGQPKVHHGRIGSADRSLRNAGVRDAVAAATNVLAFEMEGKGVGIAGFANGLDWLVVRGISDYGDEHTGSSWRGYAAVAAAAYVRALLAACPLRRPRGGQPLATHSNRR